MAKCIIKQAEQPPLFMETTKYARNAAAREVLGNIHDTFKRVAPTSDK